MDPQSPKNGCRLHVSRGVGVTIVPRRIDAPPEIPIVVLRSQVVAATPVVGTGVMAALQPALGT